MLKFFKDIQMRTKTLLGILFVSLVVFSGCSMPQSSVSTTPYDPEARVRFGQVVYQLPQTTIRVDAKIVRKRYIAGPFAPWAEEYLSIQDVPQKDSVFYSLADLKLSSFNEADPEHAYQLNTNGQFALDNVFSLTSEGLIADPEGGLVSSDAKYLNRDNENEIYFTDYSVKRNLKWETDTLYKIVFRDSIFVKTPVLKDQIAAKSMKEKAWEASKFIIKTRKRRFKLSAAQYEIYPEGEALEISIKELYKVEDRYMSLFIGKTFSDTMKVSFYYTPEEDVVEQHQELFRFSSGEGIVERPQGNPVSVSVLHMQKTKSLSDAVLSDEVEPQSVIMYRVPDHAIVRINYDRHNLLEKRMLINQFGKIISMPVNVSAPKN
jgi:hypothetical protein